MALLDDAVELVVWYESQADCGTYKNDREIAAALSWFVGGGKHGLKPSKQRFGYEPADGDAARVRRARNYVDMHRGDQPFTGYSFGTKRNGAGRKFSMLNAPNHDGRIPAVDEAVGEQIGRSVQLAHQKAAEVGRQVYRYQEMEAEYFKAGEIEKALVVHDMGFEMAKFGELSMDTLSKAYRLGILTRQDAV